MEGRPACKKGCSRTWVNSSRGESHRVTMASRPLLAKDPYQKFLEVREERMDNTSNTTTHRTHPRLLRIRPAPHPIQPARLGETQRRRRACEADALLRVGRLPKREPKAQGARNRKTAEERLRVSAANPAKQDVGGAYPMGWGGGGRVASAFGVGGGRARGGGAGQRGGRQRRDALGNASPTRAGIFAACVVWAGLLQRDWKRGSTIRSWWRGCSRPASSGLGWVGAAGLEAGACVVELFVVLAVVSDVIDIAGVGDTVIGDPFTNDGVVRLLYDQVVWDQRWIVDAAGIRQLSFVGRDSGVSFTTLSLMLTVHTRGPSARESSPYVAQWFVGPVLSAMPMLVCWTPSSEHW
ncbi:hypothetical protein BJ912DRAFT_1146603 [Pholiota molesta]|nr:hypothetical protein BJ912DRAFT_1146603 [Pholiota molesta]